MLYRGSVVYRAVPGCPHLKLLGSSEREECDAPQKGLTEKELILTLPSWFAIQENSDMSLGCFSRLVVKEWRNLKSSSSRLKGKWLLPSSLKHLVSSRVRLDGFFQGKAPGAATAQASHILLNLVFLIPPNENAVWGCLHKDHQSMIKSSNKSTAGTSILSRLKLCI